MFFMCVEYDITNDSKNLLKFMFFEISVAPAILLKNV